MTVTADPLPETSRSSNDPLRSASSITPSCATTAIRRGFPAARRRWTSFARLRFSSRYSAISSSRRSSASASTRRTGRVIARAKRFFSTNWASSARRRGASRAERFASRPATSNGFPHFAEALGLQWSNIGKRSHGTPATLAFCDALMEWYGSSDPVDGGRRLARNRALGGSRFLEGVDCRPTAHKVAALTRSAAWFLDVARRTRGAARRPHRRRTQGGIREFQLFRPIVSSPRGGQCSMPLRDFGTASTYRAGLPRDRRAEISTAMQSGTSIEQPMIVTKLRF